MDDRRQKAKRNGAIPFGGGAEADEIGQLAAWLGSDQTAYVTPITTVSDGIKQNRVAWGVVALTPHMDREPSQPPDRPFVDGSSGSGGRFSRRKEFS